MTDTGEALTLLTPYLADAMIATPVSTKVNTAANEGAELNLPIGRDQGATFSDAA